MLKWTALLTLLLSGSTLQAQYYYKDIISNNGLIADMKAYRAGRIHKIIVNSFEAGGEPSEGFFCEKKISKDYQQVEILTRSSISSTSLLVTQFDEQGRLIRSNDSSEIMVNQITYQYDAAGRVSHIVSLSHSSDDDFRTELKEEHVYEYDEEGAPAKMTFIKNNSDTTFVLFSKDDQKNIAIEKNTRTGAKYYYYYDSKNRLTDIVHMNEYKQQMIPDYQFEYNSSDQLVQMVSVEEGGTDLYTWKYLYEDGLRVMEKVFNKDRKLLGSIEYEYKK